MDYQGCDALPAGEREGLTLTYLPVQFTIKFRLPVFVDNPPVFVLRSVLGNKLRSLCCIVHSDNCSACLYNNNCAFPFIFETIIPAENEVLPGRIRASHPFAFSRNSTLSKRVISEYTFTITLFGKGIDYLPYFQEALAGAGKDGLFSARKPFFIKHVQIGEKKTFVLKTMGSNQKGEVLVELKSPLRFKVEDSYYIDFTAQDFMSCLYRRMITMCRLYGTAEDELVESQNPTLRITEKTLRWIDQTHYSARQDAVMKLGGALGTFKMQGEFTPMDISLLEFAKDCNAGKNTNFGLGQVDFWPRWE